MNIAGLLTNVKSNEPPLAGEFAMFSANIDFEIDGGYLSFIRQSNGAEGFVNNSFLQLWKIGEMIELNPYYEADIDDGYAASIFSSVLMEAIPVMAYEKETVLL